MKVVAALFLLALLSGKNDLQGFLSATWHAILHHAANYD